MIGPEAGQFNGGLAHRFSPSCHYCRIAITKNNRGDKFCAEDVAASQWKYTDGSAWHIDTKLRVAATIICTLLAII